MIMFFIPALLTISFLIFFILVFLHFFPQLYLPRICLGFVTFFEIVLLLFYDLLLLCLLSISEKSIIKNLINLNKYY